MIVYIPLNMDSSLNVAFITNPFKLWLSLNNLYLYFVVKLALSAKVQNVFISAEIMVIFFTLVVKLPKCLHPEASSSL